MCLKAHGFLDNFIMKNIKQRDVLKYGIFVIILITLFIVLGSGYWLYQHSIGQAVYSTTISFMKQISDHDRLNIVNQMNTKWEHLDSILERIKIHKNNPLKELIYDLSVESQATAFNRFYIITESGKVYNSSYIETELKDMAWGNIFEQTDGNFVTRHNEDTKEDWGEYLVYGNHLSTPIYYGGNNISGIVGLVSISEITDQMKMESFDGQGIAVVIQPTGEIITASQYYSDRGTRNFLTSLESANFKKNGSVEVCKQAIAKNEVLFVEYSLDNKDFYALFQPMDNTESNNWYLVVQVSNQVIANQVQILLFRSFPFFILIGIIILIITFFIYHTMNAAKIARASEHAKSTFLANMSHEIRTPLNGIIGLQYLMHQNLDNKEKIEEYLTKAEVSAEFLKSVITDVLDMSKIESGQLEIYYNKLDLSKLINELKVILDIQAQEKKVNFSANCDELYYPFVLGDELRIKQVLTNLLGNSLKFTPKGGNVSLTVKQKLVGNISNTTFLVADTGCGMSQEFLERIWLPFEQESRIASQNGTGLGTTLSKTLVEKMNGSISVESHLGEGTIFTISIPFEITQMSEVTVSPVKDGIDECELKGKRIMIVEDNEINRMIIVSILEEQGCELTEAVNGQEAVNIFENSSNGYFDLLLMDVQMPIIDGYEATRQIRKLSRPDANLVPIFAMTASVFREDMYKALESGMDDVITKPLDISQLLKKIKNLHT